MRPIAAGRVKLGAADPGGVGEGGSSPDNDETDRYCQTVRARLARQKGVTRSEPVVEPPQVQYSARTWWMWAEQAVHASPQVWGERLRRAVDRAGREATRKVCGVLVARLSGEKLGADPADRSVVNVGTIRCRPSRPRAGWAGPSSADGTGWGGAFVVVRAGESPVHGEGRQQVCGIRLEGEEVVVE